jgi:hypothetical protein
MSCAIVPPAVWGEREAQVIGRWLAVMVLMAGTLAVMPAPAQDPAFIAEPAAGVTGSGLTGSGATGSGAPLSGSPLDVLTAICERGRVRGDGAGGHVCDRLAGYVGQRRCTSGPVSIDKVYAGHFRPDARGLVLVAAYLGCEDHVNGFGGVVVIDAGAAALPGATALARRPRSFHPGVAINDCVTMPLPHDKLVCIDTDTAQGYETADVLVLDFAGGKPATHAVLHGGNDAAAVGDDCATTFWFSGLEPGMVGPARAVRLRVTYKTEVPSPSLCRAERIRLWEHPGEPQAAALVTWRDTHADARKDGWIDVMFDQSGTPGLSSTSDPATLAVAHQRHALPRQAQ